MKLLKKLKEEIHDLDQKLELYATLDITSRLKQQIDQSELKLDAKSKFDKI